jgi:hypothetical protein
MTFLLELREAAKATTDVLMRKLLKDCADAVEHAIEMFEDSYTREAMIELNGQWAKAERTLRNARMSEPTPPSAGGLTEGAELQRAA